jgi:hypothetical protein
VSWETQSAGGTGAVVFLAVSLLRLFIDFSFLFSNSIVSIALTRFSVSG